MRNIKLLTACLGLLAGFAYTASCATNSVVLGQDFQAVIDASAPGDTLIVQAGIYPDASLVFNKPLNVLAFGASGQMMTFVGAIQVTGAGASSFQNALFSGSVQTTGATVSFFDSTFNSNVTVTAGAVTMKRTILNYPLTLSNNAALVALRMIAYSTVTATATAGSGTSFLAVQSQFANTVTLSGYTAWLGYNNFSFIDLYKGTPSLQETNCNSILIGNKFSNVSQSIVAAIIYESGGTFNAYNNLITGNAARGISLNSTAAEIANNTILVISYVGIAGIQANGGGTITLRGDIVQATSCYDIQATGVGGQALFASYCDLYNAIGVGYCFSGVMQPPVNCLLEMDPKVNADGSLNAGSPCLNAGPPDAIYNNPDGTRNTMGYTGGPYWDPANYTNSNPMVFLLTGQQVVLKGAQTSIRVNTAAAAGH